MAQKIDTRSSFVLVDSDGGEAERCCTCAIEFDSIPYTFS
jgi:hypothetical protein